MINLDWKTGDNRVLDFDGIYSPEMNFKGFFLTASKYGKVTHVCYGEVFELYKRFRSIYNSKNPLNIEYYTFAYFDNDEQAKHMLHSLRRSLYHNSEYEISRKKVNLPGFVVFSELYKHFCCIVQKHEDPNEIFSQIETTCNQYEFCDKLVCALAFNIPSNEYKIFITTTTFYNSEYNIIRKLCNNFVEGKLNNLYNKPIKTFGQINDWEPLS